MKKTFCLILLTLFLSMQNGLVFALNLPANTPVSVQTTDTYSSDTLVKDSEISFSVINDVTSDMGKVLIKKGTPVKGKVINVKKRGRIGTPGKIEIGEFYTTASNGTNIPLNGTISSKAKSKTALSITLSIIVIPFFLLMKGKDTQILQGSEYILYTATNTNI